MLRNAIRQSGRAVGAVSSSGRVVAVSSLEPSRPLRYAAIGRTGTFVFDRAICEALKPFTCSEWHWGRKIADHLILCSAGLQHLRHSMLPPNKLEATRPMPKPLQQRFPRFLSSVFGVYRKRPALRRQVVSCPSGRCKNWSTHDFKLDHWLRSDYL